MPQIAWMHQATNLSLPFSFCWGKWKVIKKLMQAQLRQCWRRVGELAQVAHYVCVCVTLGNCQTHSGTCYLLGNLWAEELTEPRTTANRELCSEPRVAEPSPSPRHFLSITASHFPVPTANCQVFHVANFLNMLHRLFFFPPPTSYSSLTAPPSSVVLLGEFHHFHFITLATFVWLLKILHSTFAYSLRFSSLFYTLLLSL